MQYYLLGVYILDSIEEKFALESEFPTDIVVFLQNDEWFVATLESDEDDDYANKLRLYQKIVSTSKPVSSCKSSVKVFRGNSSERYMK